MTERPARWTPPARGRLAKLRHPGWSDAEIAFPALRAARGPGEMDAAAGHPVALDLPDGAGDAAVAAMHDDVRAMIEVVLRDSVDPVRDLPILTPPVDPRIANRVDRERPATGAVLACDVEGQGRYRIRSASVAWPGAPAEDAAAYRAAFTLWRRNALRDGSAGPVVAEDPTPDRMVEERALAWTLGPDDRLMVEITVDPFGRASGAWATRAWSRPPPPT